MSTFVILLGGRLRHTGRLRGLLPGARFIAADGGMAHARTLGVVPELWVGDFDSTPDALREAYSAVPRLAYPAEKALTDGELAVATARERGASRIVLAGAMGGERTDHSVAHLLQAVQLAAEGIETVLTSGDEEGYPLLPGHMDLPLPERSLFSILGFSELSGLSISGARYPLQEFDLAFGSSRTLSNVSEGRVAIQLKAGRGILVARPYDLSGV